MRSSWGAAVGGHDFIQSCAFPFCCILLCCCVLLFISLSASCSAATQLELSRVFTEGSLRTAVGTAFHGFQVDQAMILKLGVRFPVQVRGVPASGYQRCYYPGVFSARFSAALVERLESLVSLDLLEKLRQSLSQLVLNFGPGIEAENNKIISEVLQSLQHGVLDRDLVALRASTRVLFCTGHHPSHPPSSTGTARGEEIRVERWG